jgi:DNA-binding LacI/PurR family transcriptional regulator
VSTTQRARIEAIARELQYEHDPLGRGLRSGKTNLLGVWVESISNASSGRLVTALNDRLNSRGYDILVTQYSDDPDEDESRIRALARRRPDYLIVLHPRRPEAFAHLRQRGHEVIMISSGDPNAWEGPLVAIDSAPSRRELAHHLVELGHRRLLILQPARRIGRPGLTVLNRVAEEDGLPLEIDLQPLSTHEGEPGLSTEDVIARLRDIGGPTFVQVNEAEAPRILAAIAASGLRIPDDVSVMTTGASSWGALHHPPLSYTDVDYYECGALAANLVLALGRGEDLTRRTIRGTYTRRESVGPAPGFSSDSRPSAGLSE